MAERWRKTSSTRVSDRQEVDGRRGSARTCDCRPTETVASTSPASLSFEEERARLSTARRRRWSVRLVGTTASGAQPRASLPASIAAPR